MKAYLFNDVQVEIDPRAAEIGGSWQGAKRNGLPTAWDGDLLRFLYEQMKPGCRFLDIGASTGSYPLLCSLMLNTRCIAFEPNLVACKILRANISLNKLDDAVRVSPYALFDSDSLAILQLPNDDAAGLACLAEKPTRFSPVRSIPIETRRLDGLGIGPVSLIKIDVEGAELMVLHGAAKTLTRSHPALLIEYDERNTVAFGYDPPAIVEFLSALGYHHFELLGPDQRDLWATA